MRHLSIALLALLTLPVSAQVNDLCSSVTPDPLAVGTTITWTGDNTGATITDDYEEGSVLASFGLPSVWHAFTLTECADITIAYCGSPSIFTEFWNVITLTCPGNNAFIVTQQWNYTECGDGNPTMHFPEVPEGTYYFPVLVQDPGAYGPYTIDITATTCGGGNVAPNDDCTSVTPESLAVGSTIVLSGDNTFATSAGDFEEGSPFEGAPVVWHAFTITECANVALGYCGLDPVWANSLGFFARDCPASDLVYFSSFNDTDCSEGNRTYFFDQLAAGTYLVPVLLDVNSDAVGPYELQLMAEACPAAPSYYDFCSEVEYEPLEVGGSLNLSGDNSAATATDDFDAGSPFNGAPVVWHGITITECVDISVAYCGLDPVWGNTFGFLATECPVVSPLLFSTFSDTDCAEGNRTYIFNDVPPGNYLVPVLRDEANDAVGPYAIQISATACSGVPPVNDDCAGAIELVPGPVCSPTSGTVANATQSIPAILCNGGEGDANDDVWYRFTATGTSHVIEMELPAGWSIVMDLRSGACDGTSIACSDEPTLMATGLTVGETYYLRLYHYFESAPDDPDFTICVLDDASPSCDADAGTLTADVTPVCLVDGNADISATPDGNAVVPDGYGVVYGLSRGASQVIVGGGPSPDFSVSDPGDYIIHTLVFDPATLDLGLIELGITTIPDVEAWLIQGGGDICGSLDMTGAPILVEDCTVPCDADAGTLTADATPVCLVGGNADVSATPDGNAVVPDGYLIGSLLAQGASQVIINGSLAPSFSVSDPGDYIIHTLVFDPATLDLGLIEPGVTTIPDVEAWLIQGGGDICGSLDMIGAPILVEDCTVPCDADAGALTAGATPVCLVGGSADISATPDGAAVVPPGYETVYVLTQGAGLVVVNTGSTPDFNVMGADLYTVHTLVFDPATLDLGLIEPGVTTAFDVEELLIQGGGDICGSLDMAGAIIEVTECVVCDANAGTLTADGTPVCLLGGAVQIGATPNGDAVVPDGYETAFVLTQGPGLVIVALGGGPVFSVNAPGGYTIHTIIYDPLTIDPGLIELGETTGFDINALLIQGGGTICGSLDMVGATVIVNDCAPGNDDCVNAFPLAIHLPEDCPAMAIPGDNTYATMDGDVPSCNDDGATVLDAWYTFNSGGNTTVTINLDHGTMEDWAVVVRDGCQGIELLCVQQPEAPIELATDPNTDYVVQVYSDPMYGQGGTYSICLAGDVPTVVCDGSSVQTSDGTFGEVVCQDAEADVIGFTTTSTSAENYVFLLTDESNTIIAQLMGGSLDFNSAALGVYRVWGVSYNGALVGADPGSLATEITSTGTCIDLSDNYVQVNVEVCSGIVGAGITNWSLFPNPGNGDFTIMYNGPDALTTVEVMDMEGRTVHQQRRSMTKGQAIPFTLGGQLAMGVYTVRLTNGMGSTMLRLVVR